MHLLNAESFTHNISVKCELIILVLIYRQICLTFTLNNFMEPLTHCCLPNVLKGKAFPFLDFLLSFQLFLHQCHILLLTIHCHILFNLETAIAEMALNGSTIKSENEREGNKIKYWERKCLFIVNLSTTINANLTKLSPFIIIILCS